MSETDFKIRGKVEFINLPNIIKSKIGTGGLSEAILSKAQELLDEHKMDFTPVAEEHLTVLEHIINTQRQQESPDFQNVLEKIRIPCIELYSNGTMFHFDLVSIISNKIIWFLSQLQSFDDDALDILTAYHTTVKAIILNQVYGDGGQRGDELLQSLNDACDRYLKKMS